MSNNFYKWLNDENDSGSPPSRMVTQSRVRHRRTEVSAADREAGMIEQKKLGVKIIDEKEFLKILKEK